MLLAIVLFGVLAQFRTPTRAETKALREAENKLSGAYGLPTSATQRHAQFWTPCNPRTQLREVSHQLEEIEEEFGRSKRSRLDIARCELVACHFESAVKAYKDAHSRQVIVAYRRNRIAKAVLAEYPTRRILNMQRMPSTTNDWLCLVARPGGPSLFDYDFEYDRPGLVRLRSTHSGVRILSSQAIAKLGRGEEIRDGTLIFTNLGPRTRGLVAYLTHFSGDSDPNTQVVFESHGQSLKPVWQCHGIEDTKLLRRPDGHLVLQVTPTWQVDWADMYEWNGKRFILANRRNARFYPTDPSRSFDDLLRRYVFEGALLDIHGQFRKAALCWSKAEEVCKVVARFRRHPSSWDDTRYFLYEGTWDEADDMHNIINEIRKRIRWLDSRDYDHPLLYRPYTWDVEVPPYDLKDLEDNACN